MIGLTDSEMIERAVGAHRAGGAATDSWARPGETRPELVTVTVTHDYYDHAHARAEL